MKHPTILAVLFLASLGAACAHSSSAPPAGPGPAPLVAEQQSVVGNWREFWGVEGETDVTYHDEYQVGMNGAQAFVVPMNQEDPDQINTVAIDGDSLDLVIHTSFDVHYLLHLDAGGATMSGTATTPDKTVPIRWERIVP